jgi:hypothetical protein
MPNTNGLTSLAPVYITGDPTSNIWALKSGSGPSPGGNLVSPVIIESADGTKTGEITVGDAPGDMNVTAVDGSLFLAGGSVNIIGAADVSLTPQDGNVIIYSANSTKSVSVNVSNAQGTATIQTTNGDIILETPLGHGIYINNTASGGASFVTDDTGSLEINTDNNISIVPGTSSANYVAIGLGKVRFPEPAGSQYAEIDVDSAGNTTIASQGDTKFLLYGSNALQIQKSGGQVGEVYDTVYNPLPTGFPTITALGGSGGGVGNMVFSQAVSVIADAMYQLQLTVENVTPVSSSYLSLAASDTGVGVINYSGVTLQSSAVVTGSGAQMTSNYFIAPDGSFTVTLASNTGAWTGNWDLQLVRVK